MAKYQSKTGKTIKPKIGIKKKVIRQKTLVRAMRRGSRRNY